MTIKTKARLSTRILMMLFVVAWAALLVGCEISRPGSAPSEPPPPPEPPPLEESQEGIPPADAEPAEPEIAPVSLEPADVLVDQVAYADA